MPARWLACGALAVVLGGCAVPRDGEFAEVATGVEARIGQDVQWSQDAAEDAAAEAAVDALLAAPLTADGVVQIALLNNQALQAAYADLGIAQAALVQAGLLRNPVFDAVFRFPASSDGDFGVNLDLGVAWEFLDVLYIPLRTRIAESEFAAVKRRVTGDVIDLATAARQAYYDFQAQQQLVGLFVQARDSTDASLAAAQAMFEAGNIPQLDRDNEQFINVQARLRLSEAEAGLMAARERLNVLMGLWGTDTDWRVDARLPRVPAAQPALDDIEKTAIANSLDLAAMRHDLEALQGGYGVAVGQSFLPDLEIGGTAERDHGAWEAGPSIALALPLFDHGQAQRAGLEARLLQGRDRYADLAIRIRAGARMARARLLQAREVALYYRGTVLPLQQDILAGTLEQYNAMQVGVFQLLQAKMGQIDSGQRYIEALADYWKTQAAIDQLLSGRLPAALPASTLAGSNRAMAPNQGGH